MPDQPAVLGAGSFRPGLPRHGAKTGVGAQTWGPSGYRETRGPLDGAKRGQYLAGQHADCAHSLALASHDETTVQPVGIVGQSVVARNRPSMLP